MTNVSDLARLVLVTALAITLGTGCTPTAKKARFTERAEKYFKAGQYDQAKIEYLNVLRIDPENANAYARSGAIWLAEGVPQRAGAFLQKATELSPEDLESRLKLARVYLGMGRPAEAVKEALAVSEKAPDNGPALLVLAAAVQKKDDLEAMVARLKRFPKQNSVDFFLADAEIAGKSGNLQSADAALQRALSADPNSPAVHSALGTLALARKDNDGADTEFQRAANLSPARSDEWIRLAQFKLQRHARDEAKAILKRLTDKTPDFLSAWNLQASIANDEKKPDEALSLLRNVLSRDPANLEAQLLQARSWAAKGEKKKVTDLLKGLDRTYPNFPMVKFELARAYLAENAINQALEELDQVVHLNPGFVAAIVLRSELQLRKGNAQAAIEPLLVALKAQPKLGSAQILLAEAYRMLGRFDEAANLLQDRIKQSPEAVAPYYLLGLVLRQQGKLSEARQVLEKSAKLAPDNPAALDQLVELDIASKAFADGEEQVDQLLQKQPNSAAGHYLKGRLAYAQNNFDSAQAELLTSIDLDSNFPRAYELLVPTLSQTKELSKSLKQMKAVLAKKPNDVAALSIASLINGKLGDYKKARDGYEKILTVKPDSVPALNNLAYIYAEKLNDLNRATELASKARTLAPDDPSVADTMGWILFKQGNYQQAVGLIEQAAAKAPASAEIQYHVGMADYMMGRLDRARDALEKAVAAPQDFPEKGDAKRRLALLSKDAGELPLDEWEKMARESPNDPVVLTRLGGALQAGGKSSKAADTYELAHKANPQLVEPVVQIAQLNATVLNNHGKALEFAKKARQLAPADPHVGALVGHIALQGGNFSWAYSLLQESVRASPDDLSIASDLAWAAYSLGRVDEARRTMQRVAESSDRSLSQSARTFLALTDLASTDKEPAASENIVDTALRADSNYTPALMARASLQIRSGDSKAALAIYSGILQRMPDFAPAQKRLAALYVNDPATLEKAGELATKASRTLGADPEIGVTLGTVSYFKKEYARAAQILQESDREKPLDATALFRLGMSQFKLGRKADATQTLTRAINAGLENEQAAEARSSIAELKASGGR